MQEYASRLVGLYLHHKAPHAISVGFYDMNFTTMDEDSVVQSKTPDSLV